MGQQHNELLRAGDIRGAIKDVLEISEPDAGVERLGETLTPVLDIWSREEWAFLRNEFRFATAKASVAAVAAQFGFAQLQNLSTNRIVVVTGYWATNGAGVNVVLAITNTVRGATGTVLPILTDTRAYGGIFARQDAVVGTQGTSAAFGTDSPLMNGAAGSSWVKIPFPTIVLAPTFGVVISDSIVNNNFGAAFEGYSRLARAGELA